MCLNTKPIFCWGFTQLSAVQQMRIADFTGYIARGLRCHAWFNSRSHGDYHYCSTHLGIRRIYESG
jgi:hypothetical protein